MTSTHQDYFLTTFSHDLSPSLARDELSDLVLGEFDPRCRECPIDLLEAQGTQVFLGGYREFERHLDDLLKEGSARVLIASAVALAEGRGDRRVVERQHIAHVRK